MLLSSDYHFQLRYTLGAWPYDPFTLPMKQREIQIIRKEKEKQNY
jgi:hypothetical protein